MAQQAAREAGRRRAMAVGRRFGICGVEEEEIQHPEPCHGNAQRDTEDDCQVGPVASLSPRAPLPLRVRVHTGPGRPEIADGWLPLAWCGGGGWPRRSGE
jgi:hypothetical protein